MKILFQAVHSDLGIRPRVGPEQLDLRRRLFEIRERSLGRRGCVRLTVDREVEVERYSNGGRASIGRLSRRVRFTFLRAKQSSARARLPGLWAATKAREHLTTPYCRGVARGFLFHDHEPRAILESSCIDSAGCRCRSARRRALAIAAVPGWRCSATARAAPAVSWKATDLIWREWR